MPDLVPCFKPTVQEPAPVAQTKPEPVEIKPSIEPEPVQPIVEKVQHEVEPYRVIGEAFKTYILVEQGKKLLIIDKHAAHERMLFEKFKANRDGIETQMLLAPVICSKKQAITSKISAAEWLSSTSARQQSPTQTLPRSSWSLQDISSPVKRN